MKRKCPLFPAPLCDQIPALLDQHHHDHKYGHGSPKHIFLISVVPILKCNGPESSATDHTCHCRISEDRGNVYSRAQQQGRCCLRQNKVDDYVYGGGPAYITNIGRNRIHEKKNLYFWGHTANAYGLFGGLFFDRVKGYGLVYRGNGVSIDLDKNVYDFSPFNKWAIDFIKLADDIAQFDYPEKDGGNNNGDNDKSFIIYIIIGVIAAVGIAIGITIIIYKKKKGKDDEETPDEALTNSLKNE